MRAALIVAAVLFGIVMPVSAFACAFCGMNVRSAPWWETTADDIDRLPCTDDAEGDGQ